MIPIQNLDADVSESLDGITLDANQRMQNMSVFSTASPGSRRLRHKNKKSLQREIVGNWSSNNYLDMDRVQRRKFIPNPCSDRRFEVTQLPQIKVHGQVSLQKFSKRRINREFMGKPFTRDHDPDYTPDYSAVQRKVQTNRIRHPSE